MVLITKLIFTCKIEYILEREKLFLLSVDFRCSPKAWHENLAREAANPRLSILLAVDNLNIDENDKKDKVEENGDSNEQFLSVCLREKKDLNGI